MTAQHRAFGTNTTYAYAKEQVLRVATELGTFTLVQVRQSIPNCNASYIERAMKELREEGYIEHSHGRNKNQGSPRLYSRRYSEVEA